MLIMNNLRNLMGKRRRARQRNSRRKVKERVEDAAGKGDEERVGEPGKKKHQVGSKSGQAEAGRCLQEALGKGEERQANEKRADNTKLKKKGKPLHLIGMGKFSIADVFRGMSA